MGKDAIYTALSKFRGDVGAIKKDALNKAFEDWKTGKIPSYASLDSIWKEIQKPLSSNGLCIIQEAQRVGDTFILQVPVKGGNFRDALGCWIRVLTRICHSSGEEIELDGVDLPCEVNVHKIGACITYGKRYGLAAALGLSTEEDDDGNMVSIETSVSIENPTLSVPRKYKEKEANEKFKYTDMEIEAVINKHINSMNKDNANKVLSMVMAYDHVDVNKAFKSKLKELGLKFDDEKGSVVSEEV